jgi:hypothetical protein
MSDHLSLRNEQADDSRPMTTIEADPELMGTAADIASGVFSSEYDVKGIPTD